MIPSVNFHLWEPCNMRCKFCFATFQDVKNSILPKGHLPKEQSLEVVEQLAEIGFEKITFAGGEPTLCPWLPDLIKTAKEFGMTTMIVTNGSKLSEIFLQENKNYLDWIAISIDSLNPETNLRAGRAITGKKTLSIDDYKILVDRVKKYGYGLKINTVVHRLNHAEDMSEFIDYAKPKRWKIFQVLPISGQNDNKIDDLKIGGKQFLKFVERHKELQKNTVIIPESNDDMKGSYAMVDPAGRFYDNAKGKHNYSRPILDIGARLAIQQVNYDFTKFVERGGIYKWKRLSEFPVKITLSGKVASGKTTIGKLLAKKLNYKFVSIGNKTREFAEKQGLDIVSFQNHCLQNPEIDKQIDKTFSKECNEEKNLIIDYRLGFLFIRNAFHIFIKISDEAAIQRLKNANRQKETHHTVKLRNYKFSQQFFEVYGIDYTAEKNYDLIIDADNFSSPDEIADFILNTINEQL